MDFDDQLFRYFGTADLSALTPAAVEAGTERMRVDFGLETNRGRRFALWALMHMLGVAPDLDVAFADEAERDAARDFMELAERGAGERSEEHTSELQSLMRISYAVFCLKKKQKSDDTSVTARHYNRLDISYRYRP